MVSDADLLELRQSKGKYAQVLSDMCKFYRDWHVKTDGFCGNHCIIRYKNLGESPNSPFKLSLN
jgi:hypothetical protein